MTNLTVQDVADCIKAEAEYDDCAKPLLFVRDSCEVEVLISGMGTGEKPEDRRFTFRLWINSHKD